VRIGSSPIGGGAQEGNCSRRKGQRLRTRPLPRHEPPVSWLVVSGLAVPERAFREDTPVQFGLQSENGEIPPQNTETDLPPEGRAVRPRPLQQVEPLKQEIVGGTTGVAGSVGAPDEFRPEVGVIERGQVTGKIKSVAIDVEIGDLAAILPGVAVEPRRSARKGNDLSPEGGAAGTNPVRDRRQESFFRGEKVHHRVTLPEGCDAENERGELTAAVHVHSLYQPQDRTKLQEQNGKTGITNVRSTRNSSGRPDAAQQTLPHRPQRKADLSGPLHAADDHLSRGYRRCAARHRRGQAHRPRHDPGRRLGGHPGRRPPRDRDGRQDSQADQPPRWRDEHLRLHPQALPRPQEHLRRRTPDGGSSRLPRRREQRR
jgi:hypothetical protein